MDAHDAGHRAHKGVAEPLCQFVERDDAFPGEAVLREGGTGPGIAERGVVDCGAGATGGPHRGETGDEDGPEGWDCDDGDGGGAGGWVREKVV